MCVRLPTCVCAATNMCVCGYQHVCLSNPVARCLLRPKHTPNRGSYCRPQLLTWQAQRLLFLPATLYVYLQCSPTTMYTRSQLLLCTLQSCMYVVAVLQTTACCSASGFPPLLHTFSTVIVLPLFTPHVSSTCVCVCVCIALF